MGFKDGTTIFAYQWNWPK
jgi:hypothetical protein